MKGAQQRAPLRVEDFYSDLLYQPWYCATTPIRPEWLQRDNLERRKGLSMDDFQKEFELPNRPVVISDAVSGSSSSAMLHYHRMHWVDLSQYKSRSCIS